MGAGGAKATGIALVKGSVGFRLRGDGIDIRRGRGAAVDASCNFLDDSVKLRSSLDRRGKRDCVISGELFGDDGGDGS